MAARLRHQSGPRGQRRASTASTPKLRPAPASSTAAAIMMKAPSLLAGVRGHIPISTPTHYELAHRPPENEAGSQSP